MQYVDVVKQFILAERTSYWHLHLRSVHAMLNVFAVTGHNNYSKSGQLYLQLMDDLPSTHPWLYAMFTEKKLHTIRRLDKFWVGLSTDLVIEQTMMRAIKERGGRGIENVQLTWVHSMHQCASVHMALNSLTGIEVISAAHRFRICSSNQGLE